MLLAHLVCSGRTLKGLTGFADHSNNRRHVKPLLIYENLVYNKKIEILYTVVSLENVHQKNYFYPNEKMRHLAWHFP